uniref:Uncharacterized protein n=1 Tax=Romanomermis culicivorax TaxID=13658 RepID=A0A915KJK0_ROMCU
MTQQGVPMSDPNTMIQAQQQQLPFLLPNYPGLPMANYCQIWWYLPWPISKYLNSRLCNLNRGKHRITINFGSARPPNATSDHNSADL